MSINYRWCKHFNIISMDTPSVPGRHQSHEYIVTCGSFLLTWFNINPSMDK